MVNASNIIEGREIDEHPIPGATRYVTRDRSAIPHLAAMADQPGVIEEPKSRRTFQAGDWIVTNDPPTWAIRVRADVFDQRFRAADGPEPEPKTPVTPVKVARARGKATNRSRKTVARKPRRAPLRDTRESMAADVATSATLGMLPPDAPARPDA